VRQAAIDVTDEMLPEFVSLLHDHGLRVVGTSDSREPPVHWYVARLIVDDEFDRLLPKECESGLWLVKPTITVESLGKQRLARIASIELVAELKRPVLAAA
jgi:hypothetical protein